MRRLVAGLVAVGVLTVTGCTGSPTPTPGPTTGGPGSVPGAVLDPTALEQAAAALPGVPGKDLKPVRLAEGLLPPTNRWFSGLVFGEEPMPVYPLPHAVTLTDQGVGIGLPRIVTTGKTIMGSHAPDLVVSTGAGSWMLTAYDEASITLTNEAGTRAQVVQGSPFTTLTAPDAGATYRTPGVTWTAEVDHWVGTINGIPFGLSGPGLEVSGETVRVPAGATASWFPVPQGGDAGRLAGLAGPVTGTTAEHTVEGDVATTRLRYDTATGRTAFAALPHQQDTLADADCSLGTYPSIYGTLRVCEGSSLSWTAPLQEAAPGLDLARLDEASKRELAAQLTADVAALTAYPADTYFGGKALYRDAQLWDIARQLGATEQEAALKARIVETMDRWADPAGCRTQQAFCFTYDETNRGIVGMTPSFGSEEFNDHHFHYGYFLYAAGTLAAHDPALAQRWGPVLDLLAADIAMAPATDRFPQRRTFDVYASHSWASGTSPFADGNNQESSSEAVHAWAGLTLWARARGNAPLEQQARWMHALEAQAARAYWTDHDRSQPVYQGYEHTIVPLNFGGKRDYATWFSAEPAAALAILVIPASPSSGHLVGDPERIRANVAEGTARGGFTQQYGDYLLMYAALAGPQDATTALTFARENPQVPIDDGNTRTYLLAFLMDAAS